MPERTVALALVFAILATAGLTCWWLLRETMRQDLVGSWRAAPRHASPDRRQDYTVNLELNSVGTFSLQESFLLEESGRRSTIQQSGEWNIRGDVLRLTTEKGSWNSDVTYLEFQILKLEESQMVLGQDADEFRFQRVPKSD